MFYKQTIESTNLAINKIINNGAEILYHNYLQKKLPDHANNQNIKLQRDFLNVYISKPDIQPGIKQAEQAPLFQRDNFSSYSITNKYYNKSVASRSVLDFKQNSQKLKNKSQSKTIIPQQQIKKQKKKAVSNKANKGEKNKTLFIPLQTQIEIKKQENQRQIDDKLRKKKQYSLNLMKEQIQYSLKRKNQQANKQKRLQKERAEIKKKNIPYTFDFQGKVVFCDKLNKNIQNQFYKTMKVNIDDQNVNPEQKLNQLKSKLKPIDIIHNYTDNTLESSENSHNHSLFEKNQLDNQVYCNNNQRQVSHMSLIELAEGIKFTQNSKIKAVPKKNFMSKQNFQQFNKNKKFKSIFLQNNYIWQHQKTQFKQSKTIEKRQTSTNSILELPKTKFNLNLTSKTEGTNLEQLFKTRINTDTSVRRKYKKSKKGHEKITVTENFMGLFAQ